jgi:hypothetical protein
MTEHADGPVVVEKTYDLVLWTVTKVEKFSRAHRHQLGERITAGSLDLLLALVDATYSRDKRPHLRRANEVLNRMRVLFRLAKDLRLVSLDAYSFAAERTEEIGRMVGGWARSVEARG